MMKSYGSIDDSAYANYARIQSWIQTQSSPKNNAVLNTAFAILKQSDFLQPPTSSQLLALKKLQQYVKDTTDHPLTRLWYKVTGRSQQLQNMDEIKHLLGEELNKLQQKDVQDIASSKEAFTRFNLEFVDIFHVYPKQMSEPEKKLVQAISKRLWNSANVQDAPNKYTKYKELMTAFYKGAHFNFELEEDESFLEDLKHTVGFVDDKNDLGKEYIVPRVSSHFVRFVGEEHHAHLAGTQIPEIVFNEVDLPVKEDGTVVPGRRFNMYEGKPEEVVRAKKFFWIQTENNPDGPDWTSYLKHRTLDFVIYTCRKKLGYKDANVGPFGYGPGDNNPIIVRLKTKESGG